MGRGKGRPRRLDNENCPICGLPGYYYRTASWNSKYKDAARHMYLRFVHSDRSIPYHYVDRIVKNLQIHQKPIQSHAGSLYDPQTGSATTYYFRDSSLKQYKQTRALPLRIYFLDRNENPRNFKTWLRKLKRLTLTRKELNWLLKKETIRTQTDARKFLESLSTLMKSPKSHVFITFGHEAIREMKDMPNQLLLSMRPIAGTDNRGVLDEVHKRRKTLQQRI